ncbi:cupin domain-containing protein [Ramlibacter sp. AN1015]|uniref:cupin domain-containing protein n=1 Tax=Ramlibacter sp. AN1015 TaxID=3133428 RepID=UPI0030C4B12D
MSPEDFCAQLQAQQFAAPVPIERAAGYRLDEHTHPFDAFALVTDGEITIEVAGQQARYGCGDTFRLAAGTPHREWAGAQGVRYLAGRREPGR